MLKRQRPPSPPFVLSTTPSPSDFINEEQDKFIRDAKRRRIVAPSLDGRERGFQSNDDDWIEDEGEEGQFTESNDATHAAIGWPEHAGQYKDTNTLLHRLHLEHQRRTQLSPPQSSYGIPHSDEHTPLLPGHYAKFAHLGSSEWSHPSVITEPSEGVKAAEELSQVRARYEQQNRLLGSLVRQRKQEQGFNPR